MSALSWPDVKGSRWAALALGMLTSLRAEIVLNEIHYEVSDEGVGSEFIELYNSGSEVADLGGWFLSDAVFYVVPARTRLEPGEYLVIAKDTARIQTAWGTAALGPFEGRLSNEGDEVVLRDADGNERDRVEYGVGFPWPTASAGTGSSMELIHPALDNDLGGSWRASLRPGPEARWPEDPVYLVGRRSYRWAFFKGTTPPSEPPSAWREPGFLAREGWQLGRAGFGYGGDDDFTELPDMPGGYTSIFLRKEFVVRDPAALPALRLRVYTDNGCLVWVNGVEAGRFHVLPADPGHDGYAGEPARGACWEERTWNAPELPPLVAGTNVIAVQALKANAKVDSFSIDVELLVPAGQGAPTPGRLNSVYAEQAPPQIRQVSHDPVRPMASEAIFVSARVTDPDGVSSVRLRYQIVNPGAYVPAFLPVPHEVLVQDPDTRPAPNPAFEDPANWVEVAMRDDGRLGDREAGDGIFTGGIPPQENRTLVRYRILAADRSPNSASVMVPYADDRSLNFAAFVYDGVPPYRPGLQTVHPEGLGHEYSTSVMTALPVYQVLVRESDFVEAHGYDPAKRISAWRGAFPEERHPAYSAFNWEAAFVYDDEVYDHVRFRLRQDNARYGERGKRSLRFRFNPGHRFQARDEEGREYPVRWRSLNLGKMSDLFEVGDYGLPEWMNYRLWRLVGVPAPQAFHVHLRVVDGPDEAPSTPDGQFHGDFWGMYLVVEDYDAAFLEARGMPDGNLYKLAAYELDGTRLERHRAANAPAGDADFQNVWRNVHFKQAETWLRAHVNYPLWFRYFAVAEAVRHTDFGPAATHNKNQAWFFEPSNSTPLGQLSILPWDTDLTWGPGWGDTATDYPRWALNDLDGPGHAALRRECRSVLRSFLDFFWGRDLVIGTLARQLTRLRELSNAERDRWRGAPRGYDDGPLSMKVQDMVRFAFLGWEGKNGTAVASGGRTAHLESVAFASTWPWPEDDAPLLPEKPQIAYTGAPGFPVDALTFAIAPFRDPQGDDSFGAARWRVAEVNADASLAPLEWDSVWESPIQTEWRDLTRIPSTGLRPGRLYRVRAQVSDRDGYWSRWSEPVQFVAGASAAPFDYSAALRVTEIMYNPPGGPAFEYFELMNVGGEPVDLRSVSVDGSVAFRFAGSRVEVLQPGQRVLVVEDVSCFGQRYGNAGLWVAGEYSGNLPNSSGELRLVNDWTGEFLRCVYEDDWYPTTDGLGYSLILKDPSGGPSSGHASSGWQPSLESRGSPGQGKDPADRDGDGLPDAWELQNGLSPALASDVDTDADNDGHTAMQEYLAGTDPQDAASALRLVIRVGSGGYELQYATAPPGGAEETRGRRQYQVERRASPDDAWNPVLEVQPSTGMPVSLTVEAPAVNHAAWYRVRLWFEP